MNKYTYERIAFLGKEVSKCLQNMPNANTRKDDTIISQMRTLRAAKLQSKDTVVLPTIKLHTIIQNSSDVEFLKKISEEAAINIMAKTLKGTRPGFWEGWAHKSPDASFVVKDYYISEYTKKIIMKMAREYTRTLMEFCYTYCMNSDLTVISSNSMDNFECQAFGIRVPSLFKAPVPFCMDGEICSLYPTNVVTNAYIELNKVLENTPAIKFKSKNFNISIIPIVDLYILLAFLKNPIRNPLNKGTDFWTSYISRRLIYKNIMYSGNPTVFLCLPKNKLAYNFLNIRTFNSIKERRHVKKIIPRDLVRSCLDTTKLTNKDFFDYEQFLGIKPTASELPISF